MKSTLAPGLRRNERVSIDRPRTIDFLGEEMRVYSTPSMVGDFENTCLKLLQEHLDEGESSVGIHVEVDHLAPTMLGHWVEVDVTIESIDGRKVSFLAEIRDSVETVGRGKHVRYVIDLARHAERLKKKSSRLRG